MSVCLLCLEILRDFVKGIQVNSQQWHQLDIENLIETHFWSMNELHSSWSWLCISCSEKLYDFHQFYVRVKDAHAYFGSALKEIEPKCDETNNTSEEDIKPTIENISFIETQFESIIPLKEAIPLENLVDKNKIVIKQEEEPEEQNTNIVTSRTSRSLKVVKDERSCNYSDTDSNYEFDGNIPAAKKKKSKKEIYKANDKFLAENFEIICTLCQIQVDTFKALGKHFKTVHKQIGYAKCCGKKFYRRSILIDHVHQHVDPNYFKCTICDKVMADRKCLYMHTTTHDDINKKTYACEICNKRFSLKISLKVHKMSHLSEDEKHIPCTKCGKKFGSKSLLSNHMRYVHLKKYVNICEICGKSIFKDVFVRHILRHECKSQSTISCLV